VAGYAGTALVDESLSEWDYGAYEGRSTEEIRTERPDWDLWRDGVPQGETMEQVAIRAQKVIARCFAVSGPVLLFAHGHILRVIAACWLELPPEAGRLFALHTNSLSTLGFERETRVIVTWNRSFEKKDGSSDYPL
jgi:probable phosphoglycerate mutase